MAFNFKGLAKASSNYNAAEAGAIYTYKTTDSINLVTVVGYFDSVKEKLLPGTLINAEGSNGVLQLVVESNSPQVTVAPAFNCSVQGQNIYVGCDDLYGNKLGITDFGLGPMPNAGTKVVQLPILTNEINYLKPVNVQAYVVAQNPSDDPLALGVVRPIPSNFNGNSFEMTMRQAGVSPPSLSVTTNFDASDYFGYVSVQWYI